MKALNNVKALNAIDIINLTDYAYTLKPLEAQQKSFYNKAYVYINKRDDTIELKSYDTIVLSYNYKTKEFIKHWAGWSATTAQHIKAFCGEYLSKAFWLNNARTFTI